MAKTMSFELASPHQRAELVIHLEAFLAEPPRLDGSRPESVIYLRKCQEEVLTLSPPPHTHHTATETQHLMAPKWRLHERPITWHVNTPGRYAAMTIGNCPEGLQTYYWPERHLIHNAQQIKPKDWGCSWGHALGGRGKGNCDAALFLKLVLCLLCEKSSSCMLMYDLCILLNVPLIKAY